MTFFFLKELLFRPYYLAFEERERRTRGGQEGAKDLQKQTLELQKEFDKVEKSNFSKYCKTFEEAQETVNAYANGTHPNKLGEIIETYIVSTKYTEYPFVVKRKDGKVLKSINFKDVNEF